MSASDIEKKLLSLADHAQAVGQTADTLDSLRAALELPMPAQFHCEQMRRHLPEIVGELRRAYVGITGDDPWATHS